MTKAQRLPVLPLLVAPQGPWGHGCASCLPSRSGLLQSIPGLPFLVSEHHDSDQSLITTIFFAAGSVLPSSIAPSRPTGAVDHWPPYQRPGPGRLAPSILLGHLSRLLCKTCQVQVPAKPSSGSTPFYPSPLGFWAPIMRACKSSRCHRESLQNQMYTASRSAMTNDLSSP
ncbi:hypothetical protein VTK26DRAFT_4869 [Humicola hyalothermophila]